MLILQRKEGDEILIGDNIVVSVVSIDGGRVRLAVTAPREIPVLRRELLDATRANQDAAVTDETKPQDLLSLLCPEPKQEET